MTMSACGLALRQLSGCATVHSAPDHCSNGMIDSNLLIVELRQFDLPLSRDQAEAHMNERMILLRAVDGRREGWRCMALEEFLQRLDLRAWRSEQLLVGMVLGPVRRQTAN
jgi:hypothetical protein